MLVHVEDTFSHLGIVAIMFIKLVVVLPLQIQLYALQEQMFVLINVEAWLMELVEM